MTLLMRDNEMIRKGRLDEIYSSVQDGDYSLSRGAQKSNMSVEDFKKAMLDAGFEIPTNN